MSKKLQKLFIAASLLGAAFAPRFVVAQQNFVHRVIILNEGRYDYVADTQAVPVSIGSYDPISRIYTEFDTINEMKWASDVIVDNQNIYVAGDTMLLIYDKNTYQRINAKGINGIRKMILWNDNILVSRKSGAGYNAYFQAYDKNTLDLIYELDTLNGPKYDTEGMAIYNDTCYLAVNNGFQWGNYKGLLGLIDLKAKKYITEIDLGPDGLNPDNVMADGKQIYTLNNKDWSGSSIAVYDASDRNLQVANLPFSSGCGSSVLASAYIYYQQSMTNQIVRFNRNTFSTTDTLSTRLEVYGIIPDTINNVLYATSTDYFSYGKTFIMQYNGTLLDSFNVGISPGNLALDIRQTTGINDLSLNIPVINIYPNPAFSAISIKIESIPQNVNLLLTDVTGKTLLHESLQGINNYTLDVQKCPSGFYFLTIEADTYRSTHKVIKM